MVSSVIDLLLRTLFNIEAATVVTLSVESYSFVFTVCMLVNLLYHSIEVCFMLPLCIMIHSMAVLLIIILVLR